jgi:hypothetical protein
MSTRYFFFGTLMDRDVLELVLDRPVAPAALAPARLPGYRRVRILRDSFPILVEDPSRAVEGYVFTTASAEEDARILYFEDYDYDLAPCRPTLLDGQTVEATFCGAEDGVLGSDELWELERWAVRHKPGFLELSRIYMSFYGRLTAVEADALWTRERERLRAEGILVVTPELAPAAEG